jgi:exosortase/archaeosortase family protein
MIAYNKNFVKFATTFVITFLILYYGVKFITGLAVKGGYYSPFVEKYLNIAAWIRTALIVSTKSFLLLVGVHTDRVSEYVLRMVGGRGVRIVYGCLGFAVMCFWIAYVFAVSTSLVKKFHWFLIGLSILWIINVIRISLVLIATNRGWRFPFGLDHHAWFNIIAYLVIFIMIYFFEKSIKFSTKNAG